MDVKKITVGDIVKIKSQSTKRMVYQTNKTSALISWGQLDYCWWPLAELSIVPPDLFAQKFPTLAELTGRYRTEK